MIRFSCAVSFVFETALPGRDAAPELVGDSFSEDFEGLFNLLDVVGAEQLKIEVTMLH